MVDLKYHVYTIVAIFLALAIGILLGVSMGGGLMGTDAINRQSTAINRLNEEFQQHKETLAAKQSALDALAQDLRQADVFISGMYPPIIQGRLAGRSAAIIQIGQGDEVTSSVRKALQLSGAQETSVTRIDANFSFTSRNDMKRAAEKVPLEFQDPTKEPYQHVWGFFSTVVASGREGEPLAPLASVGLLTTEGDYSKPSRYAIVVMPKGAEAVELQEVILTPLLNRLKAAGLQAVVCGSSIPGAEGEQLAWTQMDVPTISHAHMAFGQISLVETLVTGEGHYGLGPDEEILPVSILSQQ